MVFSRTLRGGLYAAVALVGLAGTPALAQEISPSHLAAAREAVDSIDTTEQFDQILLNAATQIKAELIVNNPDLQSKISEMVDDSAIGLAPRRADLENEVARIYAKMFTEQELREISQFYNSEAGRKLIKQGPQASREMMAAADVWTNGIVRDLRESAQKGMQKLAPAGAAPAKTQ
ncbi:MULTISPECIES: DUF2059 domain-containing protein [unclassified Aureimonas]|uniref:DUF2059 domain-containing protein n=1 Tax=unclassified Aureimonas TaxID=2615206 RepID=UPI0007201DAB|nr:MULTISPECIES: DUF2059 domain-containing protein [unclassified Aureimonas]ALN73103.1 hypothetical protein M673_10250 [Aureimonas sp. AU20]